MLIDRELRFSKRRVLLDTVSDISTKPSVYELNLQLLKPGKLSKGSLRMRAHTAAEFEAWQKALTKQVHAAQNPTSPEGQASALSSPTSSQLARARHASFVERMAAMGNATEIEADDGATGKTGLQI